MTEAAAKSGHNLPPMPTIAAPADIQDAITAHYADLAADVTAMLNRARELPVEVDAKSHTPVSTTIKDIRELSRKADALRVKEKDPYLRGGDVIHQFFKEMIDRLDKTQTILNKRLTVYDARRAAEERQRRAQEAAEAARIAREAEEKRIAEERAAAESAAAAARARKQENIEAHQERAAEHEAAANEAAVDQMIANDAATQARHATMVKTADLTRTRHETGVMSTMRQVPYVEIVDRTKLDKEALWPFIRDDELLKALKAYGRTTSHKKPMEGAIIELRDESIVR